MHARVLQFLSFQAVLLILIVIALFCQNEYNDISLQNLKYRSEGSIQTTEMMHGICLL